MDKTKNLRGRQTDETAEHTRQRIVRSAMTLFAARGFQAVSLRDIAAHSGVSHGLIRYHFGSKEDIWRAAIDALFDEVLEIATPLIEAAVTGNSAVLPAVKAVSRTVIEISARYPELPRLLMHEGVEGGPRLDYFMARLAAVRAWMDPLIDTVQRAGGLRNYTHDTLLLSLIILGGMPFALAAFSNELCHFDILAAEQAEQHADRVIATLFSDG